jgi:hypothetical protein
LELSGKDSKSIRMSDIDRSKFKELFKISKEVDPEVIKTGTVFK